MIEWKIKLWRSAGAAALIGLSACGPSTTPESELPPLPAVVTGTGEAAIGESGAEHGGGEAGAAMAYMGLQGDQLTALRLQHLKGFLLVADQVASAQPAEASVLAAQGILEVHDHAADQFGAYDIASAKAVADGGADASATLKAKIARANSAIDAARTPLNVNYADLATRMIDVSAGLYQQVNQPDFIDPLEYQHSLGAALAARDALIAGEAQLRPRNQQAYDEAKQELDRLIALWPQPVAPERPATYAQVLQQGARVKLALSVFLS